MHLLICLAAGVFVMPPVSVDAAREASPPTAKPVVRMVQTEPATVVYVEHIGPYWTVRARLGEVVAYMRSRGLAGAVYVRYGSDPTGHHAGAIRSEIGFVSRDAHQPEQPFQRASREAEWVVSMPMSRPGAIPPRYYRQLRHWVTDHGYRPLGPVIEWYPNGFGTPVDSQAREPVSLRMPVEPPESSPPSGEATGSEEVDVVIGTEDVAASRPSVDSSPAVSAPAADKQITLASRAIEKTGGTLATPEVHSQNKEAAPTPHDIQPVPPPHSQSLSDPFVDDGTPSVAALLETGHVEAIVQRLMPAGQPIAADQDLWLGQIVFRVSAAGKGLARTYPQEKGHVSELAKAIKNRYRAASTEPSGSVLSQVVVRVPRGGSRPAKRRQSVLRDMDRLLGRIAIKAVNANQARDELAELLARVEAVLSENRAVSP